MSIAKMTVGVLFVGTLFACGGGIPSAEQFPHEQAVEGLAEIREALGNNEDPGFKCVASQSHASRLTTEEGLKIAAELEQVCGFDTPLWTLGKAVEKAEKARKAQPEKNPLSECYSAPYKVSTRTLNDKGHGAKPEVTKLQQRWDKVCPPKS